MSPSQVTVKKILDTINGKPCEGDADMLVVTREVGKSIMIGNEIEVVVQKFLGGGKVRIGIIAPKCFAIKRKEIYEHLPDKDKVRAGYEKASQ